MKTYSEISNKEPIDWNKRLSTPIKDIITEEMWSNWRLDAANWTTCACGNQCSIIPRYKEANHANGSSNSIGQPIDKQLAKLGLKFSVNIIARDLKTARKTLAAIEKRSIKLIKKEQRKFSYIFEADSTDFINMKAGDIQKDANPLFSWKIIENNTIERMITSELYFLRLFRFGVVSMSY